MDQRAEHKTFYPVRNIFWRLFSLSSPIVGLAVAAFLYVHYNPGTTDYDISNINSWSIMQFAPLKGYALLHLMLISNVAVIIVGTIVYFVDILRGFQAKGATTGTYSLVGAMLFAVIAIFVCVEWVQLYVGANIMVSIEIGSAEKLAESFLASNDFFVIVVFSIFTISDILLMNGYTSYLRNCLADERDEFEAKKRFAQDSLLFVDIPVLLGSAILLMLGHFVLSNPQFRELGAGTNQLVSSLGGPAVINSDFKNLVPATFLGGFFLGSTICQLAYSQIVFTALNFRVSRVLSETTERPSHSAK